MGLPGLMWRELGLLHQGRGDRDLRRHGSGRRYARTFAIQDSIEECLFETAPSRWNQAGAQEEFGGSLRQVDVLKRGSHAGASFTLDPARRVAQRLPQAAPRGAQVAFAQDVNITPRGASSSFDVNLPSPLATDKPVPLDAALHPAAAANFSADTPIKLPFPGDPHSVGLGEKTIEGVRVTGTRTTVVIPAAAIGNRAPIEIVTEQWFSPELNVVMLSEHRDPRLGETRYRLHDISRSAPDAALFRVPEGYTVSDGGPALPR